MNPNARIRIPSQRRPTPLSCAIIERVKAGTPSQTIARDLGCSEYTVYRVAQEAGLQAHRASNRREGGSAGTMIVRDRRHKYSTEPWPELRISSPALYQAGFTPGMQVSFTAEPGRIVIARME